MPQLPLRAAAAPPALLLATFLAAACTATDHHDASRDSLEHDLARAALDGGANPLPAPAGAPPTDRALTADAAVVAALSSNPSFRADVLAAHEAALAVDAVALGPTPMVMLEIGVPLTDTATVPILALLTASLTDLVTRGDRMEIASLRAQAMHLSAIDAATMLSASVRERHAMAWRAQESLHLAEARFALAQTEADRESALASKGLASVRRDQAGAAMLASARAQLEQARSAHTTAVRALAAAMGCARQDVEWAVARPELPPWPDAGLIGNSAVTPAARMAVALAAATRIEAELVRSGLTQNANLGTGYMQDEEDMKAIPIVLQFALPIGAEGATRDERAALMDESAALRAEAALQQAHVRLADALDREASTRMAAEALERTTLAAARTQHERLRTLAQRGAATTKERDQVRMACIDAEAEVLMAHANACIAASERLAASAGLDLAQDVGRRAER